MSAVENSNCFENHNFTKNHYHNHHDHNHQKYCDIVNKTNPPDCDSEFTLRVFDEFSRQIFDDPFFLDLLVAWNTNPATLYKYCKTLGIDRVKGLAKDIKANRGIKNPGAYFVTCARRMTSTPEPAGLKKELVFQFIGATLVMAAPFMF